ncbi:MAG: ABC transporter ATP-binding protein, partial [Alcanivoracaceae bacterium]|nr:ABC transporter ATP-binding protein [Alcanivoracaceae bacterium]
GEKSRLALALLVQQKPALLLLDEPANHLDLDMREALTLALQSFEGAVVLVSHDRHLLDTSVDELVLVANGTVTPWQDDLDAYARWLRERNRSANTNADNNQKDDDRQDARQRRQLAAQKREQLRPLKQQADKLEKALEKTNTSLRAIEQQLADETLYTSERASEMNRLLQEQGALKRQQEDLEEQLLEALEKLETAEQE